MLNFSVGEILWTKIINRIECYVEKFLERAFKRESVNLSDVDIRISYLFVQDDVLDEDAVKLFVESLKYRSMTDDLVNLFHIGIQGNRDRRRLVINKKSKFSHMPLALRPHLTQSAWLRLKARGAGKRQRVRVARG